MDRSWMYDALRATESLTKIYECYLLVHVEDMTRKGNMNMCCLSNACSNMRMLMETGLLQVIVVNKGFTEGYMLDKS